MQIIEFIAYVFSLVGASGVISGIVLRRIDKLEKAIEVKEKDRVNESVIRGEVLEGTAHLAEANTQALRAVTEEDLCEEELSSLKESFTRLEHFMREKSAQYLHAN